MHVMDNVRNDTFKHKLKKLVFGAKKLDYSDMYIIDNSYIIVEVNMRLP